MTAIRDKARKILEIIPVEPGEITSTLNGTTKLNGPIIENPLFQQVTNLTHATLQADWDALPATDNKSPGMTSCNGFVGYFGIKTTGFGEGSKFKTLGRFDLDARLPEWGLGNCWVKSGPDVQPQYGDVVQWNKTHIDVSMQIDDDGTWHHADGGQGGRRRPDGTGLGYDIVKRKKEAWNWKQIRGWVDIDILAASMVQPQAAPVPDWLPYWWLVKWRGDTFYYKFNQDRTVRWSKHSPLMANQTAPGDGEPGKYVIDKSGKVVIHWPTGTDETFKRVDSGSPYEDAMTGVGSGTDPLTAVTYF